MRGIDHSKAEAVHQRWPSDATGQPKLQVEKKTGIYIAKLRPLHRQNVPDGLVHMAMGVIFVWRRPCRQGGQETQFQVDDQLHAELVSNIQSDLNGS